LLAQRTRPYSYEHDVLLSGRDNMALQGFPKGPEFTPAHLFQDDEVRSLAGESYFLPVMGVLVYTYYLNPQGTWWQKH